MNTDIRSIIAGMTREEKAALCTGASAWTSTPVERLGVPEMIVSDGPHGIRRVPDVHAMTPQSLPATCYPAASCSASTWDLALMGQLGAALGKAGFVCIGCEQTLKPVQHSAVTNIG